MMSFCQTRHQVYLLLVLERGLQVRLVVWRYQSHLVCWLFVQYVSLTGHILFPSKVTHCFPDRSHIVSLTGHTLLPWQVTHCYPDRSHIVSVPGHTLFPWHVTHCFPDMSHIVSLTGCTLFPYQVTHCFPGRSHIVSLTGHTLFAGIITIPRVTNWTAQTMEENALYNVVKLGEHSNAGEQIVVHHTGVINTQRLLLRLIKTDNLVLYDVYLLK